ncbi:MAG: LPS assembly lipoprotein LptE [Pseudomonadota bacterium]
MGRLAVIYVVSFALITGCGFAPRGADSLPADLAPVYIKSERNTELTKALRRALELRQVALATSPIGAGAVLTVNNQDNGQRILSVAATDGPEEYEVFQTAVFSLSIDDTVYISNQRLALTRDYTFDRNDVLGKRHEYESLRTALAAEMAQAILRRVRYAR